MLYQKLRKEKEKKDKRIQAYIEIIVGLTITIILMGLFGIATLRAMTISEDNQNKMLCESAKVSGNKEWLENCQEYYLTNDITYLRR